MWKFAIARHIQKAHKRYDEERPSLKTVYSFLNNLRFDHPILSYPFWDGRIVMARVHIVPFESFSKTPSAAVPIGRKFIVINPEWAARKFYNTIPDLKRASQSKLKRASDCEDDFMFTLGHEMGHIFFDKGNNNILLPRKRKRFINWVNEVFADFYSLQLALNNNRKTAVEVMKRKQAYRKKDKNSNLHPSWELRMKYIKDFDFGEKLIREIANDCGMKEKWLINKVLGWYGCNTSAVY